MKRVTTWSVATSVLPKSLNLSAATAADAADAQTNTHLSNLYLSTVPVDVDVVV